MWVEGITQSNPPPNKPTITQHKGEFNPPFLVIVAGETVEMPNQDLVAHNVYSASATKQFDLGFYAQGVQKEVTFDRPGLVDLRCALHKFMRGEILVVPNSYFSEVKGDGAYEIRNVPSGTYVVKFWTHEAELSRRVTVPDTGTIVVNVDFAPNAMVIRK